MGESRWYAATTAAGRLGMRALAVDFAAHGTEHLPAEGPVLLAGNHVSFLDFLLVGRAALERGRHVRFLCRHEAFDVPLVGRALEAMGHVPVDRAAPAAAYLRARRHLRAGEAVCAFPEAGVSRSWTVRALMPGVAALARETGVPVVPVAVWGPQRIWTAGPPPDGGTLPPDLTRGRRVDVALGAPWAVAPGADLREATAELGRRLTALLEGLQQRPEHRPRPGEHAPWHPRHLGGHAPTRSEALRVESVPHSAVPPSWGPDPVPPARGAASA